MGFLEPNYVSCWPAVLQRLVCILELQIDTLLRASSLHKVYQLLHSLDLTQAVITLGIQEAPRSQ